MTAAGDQRYRDVRDVKDYPVQQPQRPHIGQRQVCSLRLL